MTGYWIGYKVSQKKFYLAPLEGITGYIYRNAHHKYFPGTDKYFTPFIAPHTKRCLNSREKNDILPEHNQGMKVVPQILTNNPQDFIRIGKLLQDYGYDEINLNLGCPSGTVVAKGRGSGFLEYPKKLDAFLEEVFEKLDMKISIKTRIGKEEAWEWEDLLSIYNQYPLEELIVHPRVQKEFYKGKPDWEAYRLAEAESKNVLCYNGNIFTLRDYEELLQAFPKTEAVMTGRGAIANPQLISMLQGKTAKVDKAAIKSFHDEVCAGYTENLSGDRNVLFKMKELWFYMGQIFEDSEKHMKKIRKCQSLSEYGWIIDSLFAEKEIIEGKGFDDTRKA